MNAATIQPNVQIIRRHAGSLIAERKTLRAREGTDAPAPIKSPSSAVHCLGNARQGVHLRHARGPANAGDLFEAAAN